MKALKIIEWSIFNGVIELLAHIRPLIFISYIKTYVLFFTFTILGFLALIVDMVSKS